jgi:hypothetical protein
MPIFGKNKNVNITPTFTITIDKSDKSYTGYALADDRDKCIKELEKGANWGLDSIELEGEPAKKASDKGKLKVKAIKLLKYPSSTKGHQDSGVYKYYVDAPTRGAGSKDRLWLSECKWTFTESYDGYDAKLDMHKIKLAVKVTAKAVIAAGH